MKARLNNGPQPQVRLSRAAMSKFMIRSIAGEEYERLRMKRMDELEAYGRTLMATVLWMLHTKKGYGAKRLRQSYEDIIRVRAEFRQFYRGGEGYKESHTGDNVEDYALLMALKSIGVDLKAWEDERFILDEKTGEVSWS